MGGENLIKKTKTKTRTGREGTYAQETEVSTSKISCGKRTRVRIFLWSSWEVSRSPTNDRFPCLTFPGAGFRYAKPS